MIVQSALHCNYIYIHVVLVKWKWNLNLHNILAWVFIWIPWSVTWPTSVMFSFSRASTPASTLYELSTFTHPSRSYRRRRGSDVWTLEVSGLNYESESYLCYEEKPLFQSLYAFIFTAGFILEQEYGWSHDSHMMSHDLSHGVAHGWLHSQLLTNETVAWG